MASVSDGGARCAAYCRSSEILFAVSGPAGFASLEQHRDSLAFRLSRPGEIVVPVSVNGTGPFPFLLDTGSSHTVSIQLARPPARCRAGRKDGRDISHRRGCQGGRHGSTASSSGRLTAKAVMASVVPDEALVPGSTGCGVCWVRTCWRSARYTLDFRDRLVIWGDPTGSAGSCRQLWHDAIGGQIPGRGPSGRGRCCDWCRTAAPRAWCSSKVRVDCQLAIAAQGWQARAVNPDRTCERRRDQAGAASSWPADVARSPGGAAEPAGTLRRPRATGCSRCTCSTV